MTRIKALQQRAARSDYYVRSILVRHEMFYSSDLKVDADVCIDNHPKEPSDFGTFHTELFNMLGPHTSPLSYKRTWWKRPDGSPIEEGELSAVLDLELRAFLMNRFNAELYDLTEITFPKAALITSWWRKLLGRT